MARKTKTRFDRNPAGDDTAQAIRDSAQKIWLAGLGAFERARSDGPRVFESLIEQGRGVAARAVGAADDALKNIREGGYGGAANMQKVEQMLEQLNERVRGMAGLGGERKPTRKAPRRKAKAASRKAASPVKKRAKARATKKRAPPARKAGARRKTLA